MDKRHTPPALRSLALAALLAATSTTTWADNRGVGKLPQLAPATPGPFVGACEDLPARLGGLANTAITAATTVAAGTLLQAGQAVAEHCRITGKMNQRVSPVDGKTYAIQFEMRLPKAWNGRFYHQGNGGIDGSVSTAMGATGGGPRTGALFQGFAVLSSDAGHTLAQGGPAFGLDPQARLDYGYQAVGTLTPMAKQLLAAAYGKGPDRSYFGGCSNGGRHAMVTAARYANEYDGYLVGAPGYNLPLAALANIWGAQRYATVATGNPATAAGLETAFTLAERSLLSNAVLARCDALDGAVDGLVQNTHACQAKFDLMRDVPTCAGARDGSCLSVAQKQAIGGIFAGATTSNGQPFYASFPYDSGHGTAGVAGWEFNAPLNLDSGAVGVIFKVPPTTAALVNGPAFSLGLDIDAALAELYATNGLYTESAMGFMTPPNPSQLAAVKQRGAKILAYHGVSDAIFSVNDTIRWYRELNRQTGNAKSFARLYPVPGMGHCSGGPAADQADFLTPLVKWVEQGQAPGSIEAAVRTAGNPGGTNLDAPPAWAGRTRPLCPYPLTASYSGVGDVNSAGSWVCGSSGAQE